jgi:hypothetical protein
VDLPDSIASDSLATTNLLLARTERVLTAASGSSVSAPSFVSDLLDIAKELDEQIMLYHSAMNQLTRSMWRKMLSRADPRHWWRKRGV